MRAAAPGLHIHAFSPLEVWQGARSLGVAVPDFLRRLRDAGLGSLPGTAAEILDDGVRRVLCPDKIGTAQWVEVVAAAHRLGIPTTATIMFGHVESPASWARHLEVVRRLQERTGGFTEFVPLPFVHMEAPLYRQGRARPGPTWDEVVLLHAVARLALDGLVGNIQASWVKLGLDGAAALLAAGANDLGGTLMEESISRAAGAAHGPAVVAGGPGGGDPRRRPGARPAHHPVRGAGSRSGAARRRLGATALLGGRSDRVGGDREVQAVPGGHGGRAHRARAGSPAGGRGRRPARTPTGSPRAASRPRRRPRS